MDWMGDEEDHCYGRRVHPMYTSGTRSILTRKESDRLYQEGTTDRKVEHEGRARQCMSYQKSRRWLRRAQSIEGRASLRSGNPPQTPNAQFLPWLSQNFDPITRERETTMSICPTATTLSIKSAYRLNSDVRRALQLPPPSSWPRSIRKCSRPPSFLPNSIKRSI